ncbi:MAG TPA: sulfatase-like hydrolase/transferase [Croceibacterium sp.]|nr:sulfatase-like hydrolase/transferase [Croceibacterium sp.]
MPPTTANLRGSVALPATTVLKLLLLAFYLAWDYQAIAGRVASLGASPALVAWLALYTLLALALAAAAFIPGHLLRFAFAAVLAAGSVMLHSYEWATGSPLTYNAFETMLASRGDASDAASQHGDVLLQALGAAAILLAAIALPPRRHALRFGLGWLTPAGAVLALAGLLYVRGGEGARALPAPFSPIAQAGIMGALSLTEEGGPRQPVTLAPAAPLVPGDVVLVIDESVAANYLDINHRDGVHSGLAELRPGLEIVNYGVAASVTNCSAGSNRTLRFGGTRETYRHTARMAPSIWAYARKAGYRTVYLDGQRRNGRLQNLMDEAERAELDAFVQLGDLAVPQRDLELAAMVADRLHNGVAEFILVNKVGAHFPVADKFPEDAAEFAPLPARGETSRIIDMGPVHGSHRGTAAEWRLYRNAYRNTLIWSTGGFFDRLLPRAAGSGAVILYTSDHGQDLHERANPGKGTHCVNDPLPEEGAVPLVVIDAAGGATLDWRGSAAAHFDATSHFRLFPTLLQLMGYAPEDTAAMYGPTLVAADKDPMTFTANYFAALGRDPGWRPVEHAKLAAPPRSDFTTLAAR